MLILTLCMLAAGAYAMAYAVHAFRRKNVAGGVGSILLFCIALGFCAVFWTEILQ